MRKSEKNFYDATITKINWPALSYYEVEASYWHRGGYKMTETTTFHTYAEAKKFANKINA